MQRLLLCLVILFASALSAHQPIMDMAPRWSDGYGVQTRFEHFNSQTTTWLEGVYTFKPSVRMTLKIPHANGETGDAIFAVPLKKYKNEGAFTSNWSLTPSVKIPTGNSNDWDPGLSVSYSSETPGFYQLYDLYAIDDKVGLDVNVGFVKTSDQGSALFTLWDITALDSKFGQRVLSGPVMVYFRENFIVRAEYKFSVHDRDSQWDGNYFSLGVGLVY